LARFNAVRRIKSVVAQMSISGRLLHANSQLITGATHRTMPLKDTAIGRQTR